MAKKKGLNPKDHMSMQELIKSGVNTTEISEWLQVNEEYVKAHVPKKRRAKKKVE